MHEKGEYVKFKNHQRKTKSPFMIYADFKSILKPEDNGKQNPKESYSKSQKTSFKLNFFDNFGNSKGN